MVQFKQMNLLESWVTIPRMDVVFLRNVMIYFDQQTKKRILEQVRATLQSDGYLFTGGTESPLQIDRTFEQPAVEWTGCYSLRR